MYVIRICVCFSNFWCSVRLECHLLYSECVLNSCYLYLFTCADVQRDFYIRWCSCRLTVTRRVSQVEQELPTLLEHTRLPPILSRVRVSWSLVFCVMFYKSLFVLLSVFIWTLHCLSFFDSINSFGIFNFSLDHLANLGQMKLLVTKSNWSTFVVFNHTIFFNNTYLIYIIKKKAYAHTVNLFK